MAAGREQILQDGEQNSTFHNASIGGPELGPVLQVPHQPRPIFF